MLKISVVNLLKAPLKVRGIDHLRPVMTGAWSKSNVFERCKWHGCNGLKVNGVCQKCGHRHVCAWCGKVKQSDGSYKVVVALKSHLDSHGICNECGDKLYAEAGLKRSHYEHQN